MKREIVWARSVLELMGELSTKDRESILDHLRYLSLFPQMYPVRQKGRRFRRHRWFQAGRWLVYYRVVDKTIFIRGLWPARIP
jgi:hypothetical protein